MKKLILISIVIIGLISCGPKNQQPQGVYYKIDEMAYKLIVLDSCEYLQSGAYGTFSMTHKGNCKFCKIRNKMVHN